MRLVAERRAVHPGLRIYHYAHYEKNALSQLAERHGIYRDQVAELNGQVLFDLRPVVSKAIRISEKSLSIKKLEPLYRTGAREGVSTAVDSITAYSSFMAAWELGDHAEAGRIMDAILAYNRDDCESTLQLRDWLLAL